jgi:hypothetical protein
MTPAPAEPDEPVRKDPRFGCLAMLAAALLVSCVAASAGLYWFYRKATALPPATRHTEVLRDTPSVITSMRELAVLQTASFHVERVIDLRDRQSHLFGLVQAEDAVLLVAAGDVNAGVDLGQLRAEDVVVDPLAHTATLRLPPATVLSASLDNQATYVHTRRTDALARRQETLETRARQEAERSLRDAALAGGILQRAQDGAERTIRSLLRSLGYHTVQVQFRAE